MVLACFSEERLGSLIVCDKEAIGEAEYEDILYDRLFSLIDDFLTFLENTDLIQIAIKNTFIFMQGNPPCHKSTEVLNFLAEH
jgi:hypothetical protein